jgi:hypothetical protein
VGRRRTQQQLENTAGPSVACKRVLGLDADEHCRLNRKPRNMAEQGVEWRRQPLNRPGTTIFKFRPGADYIVTQATQFSAFFQ